jgi:hypothetical protein
MLDRTPLASVGFLAFLLVACGSSSKGGDDNAGSSDQTLKYVAPCTPTTCDGLPEIQVGCADGSDPTFVCAPDNDGACHLTPECGSGSTGKCGGGDVSYAPCAPSECGPIPAIGCAPGEAPTQTCGSEDGGACTWTITCSPPPSTTPCATPDGCGPTPALAPICNDGTTGTLACMQVGSECSWLPQCP